MTECAPWIVIPVVGIPALTKSRFGKNQSYEVLTTERQNASMHYTIWIYSQIYDNEMTAIKSH